MTIETNEKYLDSSSKRSIDFANLLLTPAGWLVRFVEYQERGSTDETDIVASMHMRLGGGFHASLDTRVR